MNWHYKIVALDPEAFERPDLERALLASLHPRAVPLEVEQVLNTLGAEGWEVVGVVQTVAGPDRSWPAAILKRPTSN